MPGYTVFLPGSWWEFDLPQLGRGGSSHQKVSVESKRRRAGLFKTLNSDVVLNETLQFSAIVSWLFLTPPREITESHVGNKICRSVLHIFL